MARNVETMIAGLAAKNDAQERRIAALEMTVATTRGRDEWSGRGRERSGD
jgi:hypothetical protein